MQEIYISFLMIINIASFIMMALDKQKAKKKKRRISEFMFLILSVLGGFIGIFLGSSVFRHKTIKRSFQLKILLGMLGHFLILYLLNKYFLLF